MRHDGFRARIQTKGFAEQMDSRLDKGRERNTKIRQSVPVYEICPTIMMLHLVPDKT